MQYGEPSVSLSSILSFVGPDLREEGKTCWRAIARDE